MKDHDGSSRQDYGSTDTTDDGGRSTLFSDTLPVDVIGAEPCRVVTVSEPDVDGWTDVYGVAPLFGPLPADEIPDGDVIHDGIMWVRDKTAEPERSVTP